MIYAIVQKGKLIYKFDTFIQSEVETAMLYLGYGCREYYLNSELDKLVINGKIEFYTSVAEIKLPVLTVLREKLLSRNIEEE